MTAAQPPPIATAMLNRLVSGEKRESLIGDLIEQYQRDRSAGWYWRQVLSAILVGVLRDIREHKLRAALAVATGFSVLLLFDYEKQRLLHNLWLNYFRGAVWIDGHLFQPGNWMVPSWYLSLLLEGAVSGWIVGRLHRAHQVAMTCLFAACFVVLLTIDDAANGFRRPRGAYVLSSSVLLVGILVGGLWDARAADNTPNRLEIQ